MGCVFLPPVDFPRFFSLLSPISPYFSLFFLCAELPLWFAGLNRGKQGKIEGEIG
jgi:hypothetical protein